MRKPLLARPGATALVVFLVGAFIAGWAFFGGGHAQAQTTPEEADFVDAAASTFWCSSIQNVGVFGGSVARMHVRCTTANGDILYYAYASDPANIASSDQLLAVATAAFALGKGAWLYYDSSTSYNPPGCNVGDCRHLTGIVMQ